MSTENMNKGFAVELNGDLLIRTASDTEVAAKVNGLIILFQVPPHHTGDWDDEQINKAWDKAIEQFAGDNKVSVVPVLITKNVQ